MSLSIIMRTDEANRTQQTLKGLWWTFLGTMLQAILQIIVLAILARLISPGDFGLVGAAATVIGFSTIFSQLGVGPAIVQRRRLEERHLHTGFTVSVLLGFLFIILTFLAAPAIASFYRMKELSPVVSALSLTFLFQSLSAVPQSLMQRQMRFDWLASVQLFSYFTGYGVIGTLLAYLGKGVWALVYASLAQSLVNALCFLIIQPCPKNLAINTPALKELFYFGGGFTLGRIGNYLSSQGDNAVVGRWLGAVELGIYARAYQMLVMPATLFGQVLDTVLFPAMASIQDNRLFLYKSYRRGSILLCWLVLPLSGFCIVLAPEVVSIVLGDNWKDVVAPFQILAVGMLFRTACKLSDSLCRATAAVYDRAWRQWLFAALVVVGAWLGQSFAGLPGVAFGVLLALAVNYFLMAQLSLELLSMPWGAFIRLHLPALLVSSAASLLVFLAVSAMRLRGFHPPAILGLSALLLASLLLSALYANPHYMLGEDGLWAVQSVKRYLLVRVSAFPMFEKWMKSKSSPL